MYNYKYQNPEFNLTELKLNLGRIEPFKIKCYKKCDLS